MSTMLNVIQPEKNSSIPVRVSVAATPALLDPASGRGSLDRVHQDDCEPSSGTAHCLWCQRAFTPRSTGGSPQRFCSTGHRQAFWVAARRWIMKAVRVGLISVENLKVP